MATMKAKVALAIVLVAVVLTVYVLASPRWYGRPQTVTGNGRSFHLSILPAKGATAGNERPSIVSKDDNSIMDPDHTPLAPKERSGADPDGSHSSQASFPDTKHWSIVPMKSAADPDAHHSSFSVPNERGGGGAPDIGHSSFVPEPPDLNNRPTSIKAQSKKSSGAGANYRNVPMKDGVAADTGRSPVVPMKVGVAADTGDSPVVPMKVGATVDTGRSPVVPTKVGVVADNRRQSFHSTTTVAKKVVTTASNKLATTKPPNINYDLPFITKGSTEIRPERLPPPANSSDIYFSLLTAPKFHNLRFSLQYLTWLQTVDAKQVSIITDSEDNEWIQAFKKEGGHIYIPACPLSSRKTRSMMCCKTGAQFYHWYSTKESGQQYKWYCHFDDDIYVNIQALVNKLSTYDPDTDRYLGEWGPVGRVHHQNRIPARMLSPKLLDYQERKRDDYRYANGPAYCISAALMAKVENYFSGKRFSDNCVKSDVVMDDVLTGVIIDGVLGIDMNVTDEFKSQMDGIISGSSIRIKEMAQKMLSIGFGRFTISDARFPRQQDTQGVLSYHCLLHPEVSWCKK